MLKVWYISEILEPKLGYVFICQKNVAGVFIES